MATPSNNEIKKMHFATYKKMREQFAWLVKLEKLKQGYSGKPWKHCKVEIIRNGSRWLDWDNAYGGIKPLMDCLVAPSKSSPNGCGLILDDNPSVVSSLVMKQTKVKRGEESTYIRITKQAGK